MSNRSLLEINHDLSHSIKGDPLGFIDAVTLFLGSNSPRNKAALERYGIRIFGTRHHSDGFRIVWGGHQHEETESKKG